MWCQYIICSLLNESTSYYLDDELPTERLLLTELPDRDLERARLSLPEPADDTERDLDLDLGCNSIDILGASLFMFGDMS